MLACAIGDCNIDVFIRVVEATWKDNDFFFFFFFSVLLTMTSKCYTYMY